MMKLADVVAVLAKAVRKDIFGKIPPRLFCVLDLPIVLSTKLIKVSELLLQSLVSFGRWPVRWFWPWGALAARRHRKVRYHVTGSSCHEGRAILRTRFLFTLERIMQKSVLLRALQQEIRRHDFNYFVDQSAVNRARRERCSLPYPVAFHSNAGNGSVRPAYLYQLRASPSALRFASSMSSAHSRLVHHFLVFTLNTPAPGPNAVWVAIKRRWTTSPT